LASKSYYYHLVAGSIPHDASRLVALDIEWAKNWRAVEKIVPFCACLHSIYLTPTIQLLDADAMSMESQLLFRGNSQTTQDFVSEVDRLLTPHVRSKCTMLGHQLSSDLHTLRQCSHLPLVGVSDLIDKFRNRHTKDSTGAGASVGDTRYDLVSRVTGNGAEKLRNVSLRLGVIAVQTEIDGSSVTRMYNEYVTDSDPLKRQKLQVMNWRHAFQTALVWAVDSLPGVRRFSRLLGDGALTTNDALHRMGKEHIEYLSSEEFERTRSKAGTREYIARYSPSTH